MITEKGGETVKDIFFTGFPGFIGRHLLQRILNHNIRIHCLVQEQFLSLAKSEAQEICHAQALPSDHIQIYTGDLAQPYMGLTSTIYHTLQESVQEIYHLAAVYDLSVPLSLAHKVNVLGTDIVNTFAQNCPHLKRYVYFSTCYVAGDYQGTFYEEQLQVEQGFKNHYEETKYRGEKLIRDIQNTLPVTIIRPAIVVGDTNTGSIDKFDGPYCIMEFARTFSRFPLPYVGPGEAPLNLIPIDYLIEGTVAIVQNQDSRGKTYQIADPNPYKARDIYKSIVTHITGREPAFTLPTALVRGLHAFPPVQKLTGLQKEAFPYLNHEVSFSTKNTQKALASTSLSCPDMLTVLPTLIDYFLTIKEKGTSSRPGPANKNGGMPL